MLRVLAGLGVVVAVLLLWSRYQLDVVRRQRRERRDQELMRHRYPSSVRPPVSFDKPAAKGIQSRGGKDAA